MKNPDRQRALEIMELNPDASQDEISKRYGILARKFRALNEDENGNTIEDITRAYNLLMGITYVDEREEARKKALRENPPFLARILKRDPIQLENFFHYYKVHMLVVLVVAVFLFFSIRSCVNQVPYDFCVVFFGDVAVQDDQKVIDSIREKMPELTNPSVQFLSSNSSDPQYQSAVQMKLVAMIAAGEIDIMIVDESTFKMHASQGMYLPLDDLKVFLDFPDERFAEASERIGESEEGDPIEGPVHTYGIKLSNSQFIEDNSIFGKKLIATIVTNTKRKDKAIQFMKWMD